MMVGNTTYPLYRTTVAASAQLAIIVVYRCLRRRAGERFLRCAVLGEDGSNHELRWVRLRSDSSRVL